ncbi:hypothetical protein ACLOJK_028394 [Asimina triloba]
MPDAHAPSRHDPTSTAATLPADSHPSIKLHSQPTIITWDSTTITPTVASKKKNRRLPHFPVKIQPDPAARFPRPIMLSIPRAPITPTSHGTRFHLRRGTIGQTEGGTIRSRAADGREGSGVANHPIPVDTILYMLLITTRALAESKISSYQIFGVIAGDWG